MENRALLETILYHAKLKRGNNFNQHAQQIVDGLLQRQEQADRQINHLTGRIEALDVVPSGEELIVLSGKIDKLEGIEDELTDLLEIAQTQLQERQDRLARLAKKLNSLKGAVNRVPVSHKEKVREGAEFAAKLTSVIVQEKN